MISHLEIKGFKSLVDVSIELGAVNVFIGANGSGKSNLLEAVGLLSAIASGHLDPEAIRFRGVRSGRPSSFLSSLKTIAKKVISMKVEDGRTRFIVDCSPDGESSSKWSIIHELITYNGSEVLNRAKGLKLTVDGNQTEISFGEYPKTTSISFLMESYYKQIKARKGQRLTSQLAGYAIFSPSTPQLRGSGTDIRRDALGLGGSGLGQAIDEMMKGEPNMLGPFDIEDVYELIDWADSLETDSDAFPGQDVGSIERPIRLRIGDRFMGEGHKSVSLIEASEGALYVLFMLALVGHEESPKIFAVDNFDQALHPRLARALTRLVSEQIVDDGSRQMLATTHNPLVLDGLDILDDRIRLFTVDRDSTGASQVRRVLVTEELMAKADEGFSLSQLWTTGRLGGVPKAI